MTLKKYAFTTLFASVSATSVLAHSKAEDTTPAHETTVETVEVIELRFDDPMRITMISLTGPDGNVDITRETGLDPVTEFRAIPPETMPEGAYTVDWRGLSKDGHPMQGGFGFMVAD
ncbi:copper resistance protein [Loktanella sp. 3ANDIMAR09]|uniref:copper resistance CopC family protein n=1 Tax=Loktanella sp. 3ANDIMAR09 TaxID=1225657 RepID=UPI0006F63031|nr:copper resistance CopC family protein [Loktanella sp. 3ANDIMAR09]KQI69181.1 copper resistance protein [Loktanella sp. 3ANDIMAR09]